MQPSTHSLREKFWLPLKRAGVVHPDTGETVLLVFTTRGKLIAYASGDEQLADVKRGEAEQLRLSAIMAELDARGCGGLVIDPPPKTAGDVLVEYLMVDKPAPQPPEGWLPPVRRMLPPTSITNAVLGRTR